MSHLVHEDQANHTNRVWPAKEKGVREARTDHGHERRHFRELQAGDDPLSLPKEEGAERGDASEATYIARLAWAPRRK